MYIPEDGWQLHPLNGQTGDAYMGIKDNEKLFLKRNPSPFISALSARGITPKLVWTKTTYSGDILVAQEWKNGHTLHKKNMADKEVVELISHIHHSDYLYSMLERVGGEIYRPLQFIEGFFYQLPSELESNQFINEMIQYLEDSVHDGFYKIDLSVCHGDLNHNNFLQDESNHLYLVDWENVKISDPISDITYLLIQYFPPSQWMNWFNLYGDPFDYSFYDRVTWYSIINCLFMIKQFFIERRYDKANEYILLAKNIYKKSKH